MIAKVLSALHRIDLPREAKPFHYPRHQAAPGRLLDAHPRSWWTRVLYLGDHRFIDLGIPA